MLGLTAWAWAVWGVASFATFLALEIVALLTGFYVWFIPHIVWSVW